MAATTTHYIVTSTKEVFFKGEQKYLNTDYHNIRFTI